MIASMEIDNKLVTEQRFGSVIQQARETAKELLNQPPVTTQVKRELVSFQIVMKLIYFRRSV